MLSNKEIYDTLKEIDEDSELTVSRWEADFFDSIFKQLDNTNHTHLTPKQRDTCLDIIEKYKTS